MVVVAGYLFHYLSEHELVALKVSFIVIFVVSAVCTLIMVAYLEWKVYARFDKRGSISEDVCKQSCNKIVKQFRLTIFTNSTLFFSLGLYIISEMIFRLKEYEKYFRISTFTIISAIEVLFFGGFVVPFGVIYLNAASMNLVSHILIGISLMYSYLWSGIPFTAFLFIVSFAYFTGYYSVVLEIITSFHTENMFVAFILFFLGMSVFAGSALVVFGCLQWMSHGLKWDIAIQICTAFIALSSFTGAIVNFVILLKREMKDLQFGKLLPEKEVKVEKKKMDVNKEINSNNSGHQYNNNGYQQNNSGYQKNNSMSEEQNYNYSYKEPDMYQNQNQDNSVFRTSQNQFNIGDDDSWDDGDDDNNSP